MRKLNKRQESLPCSHSSSKTLTCQRSLWTSSKAKGFSAPLYFSRALHFTYRLLFFSSVSTKPQTIPGCSSSCLYGHDIPFYFKTYFGLFLIWKGPNNSEAKPKLLGLEGTLTVKSLTDPELGAQRSEMSCPNFWLAKLQPGLKSPWHLVWHPPHRPQGIDLQGPTSGQEPYAQGMTIIKWADWQCPKSTASFPPSQGGA